MPFNYLFVFIRKKKRISLYLINLHLFLHGLRCGSEYFEYLINSVVTISYRTLLVCFYSLQKLKNIELSEFLKQSTDSTLA